MFMLELADNTVRNYYYTPYISVILIVDHVQYFFILWHNNIIFSLMQFKVQERSQWRPESSSEEREWYYHPLPGAQ